MQMPMAAAGLFALATTPAPGPGNEGLRPGLDANQVTPGFLGFAMTAFMVIAVVLLMVSMTRRIRRVRYRAQFEQGSERVSEETVDARSQPGINETEATNGRGPGGEGPGRG
ncbi:H+/gluconate symporter-like permease [Arthrobacter sp. UYNi723]